MYVINKLKKLKRLINNRGFHLRNPFHWFALGFLGISFCLKHGVKSFDVLRRSVQKNNPSVLNENKVETHAQIWERIKPTYIEFERMRSIIPNLKKHYKFIIVVSENNIDTISSIEKQIYENYEIIIGSMTAHNKSSGDYVLFLQYGDFLHKNALFELNYELNRIDWQPSVLYFDHDYFAGDTIDKPYYKPGWSPDLFLVNNYINRACILRKDLLNEIETEDISFYASLYDILLKITEFSSAHHKPGILLTIPDSDDERIYDSLENKMRLNAIKRRRIDGIIEVNKYGVTSLKRCLHGNPKISIIIATCYTKLFKNKSKTFIESCLNSIVRISTYKNYELIIVDNSRKTSDFGKKLLKNYNCKILYINEPFNWSRLNNLGVKEASGEILIFLNDDTEIMTPDWMERMSAEAQRNEIGAVGVLELYPNGTIYGAGLFKVKHGIGTAHSFTCIPENSTAYHNLLHYSRPSIGFQGACFAIEKNKLDKAGGFNENFPIICNEVDLAFKLNQLHYYHLIISEVQIIHFERVSRKDKFNENEYEKYFNSIWFGELQKQDIYFNPYLDSNKFDYSENNSPIVNRFHGIPSLCPLGIEKIIIVKLDHIGDMILSIPAIRNIRKLFPKSQIDLLCAPWVKPIMENQLEINNIYTFSFFNEVSGKGFNIDNDFDIKLEKLISKLKNRKYNLAINLRRHPETKHITSLIADYCLEYSENAEYDSISHPIPALKNINGQNPKWNISDQLLLLTKTFEYDKMLYCELNIPVEAQNKVDKYINNENLFSDKILIGIHAGCGNTNREWSLEKYSQLCNLINEKLNASIVLVGGNHEIEINERIISMTNDKNKIISIAGKLSLLEYCYLCKKFDYYIGNNSGPAHIAGIQGVPNLVIWHGEASAEEWAPIGKSIQVQCNTSCMPCYRCDCKSCLEKIQVIDVFAGLERLMIFYPSEKNIN